MKKGLRAAAVSIRLMLAAAACGCAAPAISAPAPTLCGPFGDPPAIVAGVIKPDCPQGIRVGPWKDADGYERYACLWEPHDRHRKPLPLLIYLHPSLYGPETITRTDLLLYRDNAVLEANGAAGYIVLAPMARKTLHHYPRPDEKGLGWDTWYRQFDPSGDVTVSKARYRLNADAAAIDYFLAVELATGKVDQDRIYVIGWSNGAAMAYLYGLNRRNIAAAVLYSAPDPFGALGDPCPQRPRAAQPVSDSQIRIFNPGLPALHVHNSCDIAGLCPNAERMAAEVEFVRPPLRDAIIDYSGNPVNQCISACGSGADGALSPAADPLGYSLGFIEHSRWPRRWTPRMLDFLGSHSLSGGPHHEVDLTD